MNAPRRPRTALATYIPVDDLASRLREEARKKIEGTCVLPTPTRSGWDVLLGRNNTLVDQQHFYQQLAERDRAVAVAVRARIDLLVATGDIASVPDRIAHANEIRTRVHDITKRKLDYEEMTYNSAISDLELRIARNNADITKLDYELMKLVRRPSSAGKSTPREREFAERVNADLGVREQLEEAIAEVNASDLSPEQKSAHIAALRQAADDILKGAE